ncbi:MAG: type II toxin-antitoxin system VapC family toxin [Acidimicrobiaceae bacterium]|nr:type II toxin-antitoxin system VapC family toxin [Acidimicrobiaceae bacterium]MXW61511.1 type II toxin-antitoxin system VapC family toxin [Acidimicrobiaceae bacterium]MXW76112.1 type II toxin-antitoxin system VapC family toxin [Acidimicrobiaceae bacterium]MYA74820.1 type II toxin-antitoxin system VapC family toxin [Acidimicrobiaceae bacterium]MYC40981.1 type II toxin-antitoxin system VapC family toxin [Acidimicrobiaceae bacterium]
MTLYVDTSALLKRYISERDSDAAEQYIAADPTLVTCRLTEVELRRNLARLLKGGDLLSARRQVQTDLNAFALVSIDSTTCNRAAVIAEQTLCRSLDALHVAAAQRAGESTTFLTFDMRQAQAARSVGLVVLGA